MRGGTLFTKEELAMQLSKAGRRFYREILRYSKEVNTDFDDRALHEHVNLAAYAVMMPLYRRLATSDFDDPDTDKAYREILETLLTHIAKHAAMSYGVYQADFNDRKHRRQH